MTKLKIQRYFVLLSSKGVPVLSSLIAREKKPKNGEWLEVNLRPCCTTCVTIEDASAVTDIIIKSAGVKLASFPITGAVEISDISSFINEEFPAVGTFSQDGDKLCLKSTLAPSLSLEAVTA